MKSGKVITKAIEEPNLERIRTLAEMEFLQILGNIGNGHHQRSGDERKNNKKSASDKRESRYI